jgi:hypothetical protein
LALSVFGGSASTEDDGKQIAEGAKIERRSRDPTRLEVAIHLRFTNLLRTTRPPAAACALLIRDIRAIRGLSQIRFNDLTAAKQLVFIRVYSWLRFADGCG